MVSYLNELDLRRYRLWMILTVVATHLAGAGIALLVLHRHGESWGLQLRLTNPLLGACLVLLGFSALISGLLAVVVSQTQLRPVTAWVIAVLAAPAALALLTLVFVAANT